MQYKYIAMGIEPIPYSALIALPLGYTFMKTDRVRFELTIYGFKDHCLTTWLPTKFMIQLYLIDPTRVELVLKD